jgi:hypothetical protein
LSEPITWLRSRSGRAFAERNPLAIACGVNCGQRSRGAVQIDIDHCRTELVAVAARPLVVLHLEKLKQPGPLIGGRHCPQRAALIGQDNTGGGHIEQLNATDRQDLQEVDDVKVIDQGVRQFHKSFPEMPFPIHCLASQPSGANDLPLQPAKDRSPAGSPSHSVFSWNLIRRATTSAATSATGRCWL